MSDQTRPDMRASLLRHLPLAVIACVAVAGAFLLRDVLGFEALRAHREALIAFRDAHYLPSVAIFMLAYVLIVAFSLPGALVATTLAPRSKARGAGA